MLAVVAVLALGGWFAINHLLPKGSPEDVQNIQGEWLVEGSQTTCVINNKHFNLPGGTSYDYVIDTDQGLLTVSLGDKKGVTSYRLSTKRDGTTELTVSEKDGSKTVTTKFTKLSDDVYATPTNRYGEEQTDS